jgi:hypothetical protein
MKPIMLLLAIAVCVPAFAERLDDSLSPRQRIDVTPRWQYDGYGNWTEDQTNALVAEVSAMEFRLKTQPFVGKKVQIFLGVPRLIKGLRSPSAMRLEWKTRGKFSPGSLLPGDRALVFQGKITDSVMSDFFDFRIYLDGRYLERGLEFDPVFEIEVLNQ